MRNDSQPTTHSSSKVRLGRPRLLSDHRAMDALLLALSAMWVSAIVVAPLAEHREIYAFFSAICHQIPARSWFLAGEPLAACVRCTSVYAGFLSALVLRLPPVPRLLKVSVGLMLMEVTAAHLWVDLEPARAISGLLVGLAGAGFVSEGIRDMVSRRAGYRTFSRTPQTEDILEHL